MSRSLPAPRLLRQPDFRALWTGDTVSQLGTEVGAFALPVLAVTVLGAQERQMGLLTAAQTVAFLVIGLPAGAWVDRWSKRRVLVVNDLLRALVLATIPLAWALDVLTLTQLYVVAVATGVCTVFFDVAYQSVLPALVTPDDLVPANAALTSVQSAAQVAGPAVSGALLKVLPAPALIGADAASFAVSAAAISRIRAREAIDSPARIADGEAASLGGQIGEGLRFVLGHRLLRPIVATTAISNLFGSAQFALVPLLLLRDLHLSPTTFGLVMTAGAVGGLLSALVSGRIASALGLGPTLLLSVSVGLAGDAGYPLAHALDSTAWRLVLLVASGAAAAFGIVVYNVAQVSFRQRLCPPHLLGRMNASIRFLVWGTMPLGGLFASVAGGAWGVVATMWCCVAGTALTLVPLLLTPLWRIREAPGPDAVPLGEGAGTAGTAAGTGE